MSLPKVLLEQTRLDKVLRESEERVAQWPQAKRHAFLRVIRSWHKHHVTLLNHDVDRTKSSRPQKSLHKPK